MERGRLQFLDRVTRGQFFCSRYTRVIGIFLIAIYWTRSFDRIIQRRLRLFDRRVRIRTVLNLIYNRDPDTDSRRTEIYRVHLRLPSPRAFCTTLYLLPSFRHFPLSGELMHDAGEKDTPPSDRLVVARKPLLPAPCARFYPSTRFRSVSLSRVLSVSTARTLTFRHFGRAAASGSSPNPRPPFLPIERYRGPQSIELRRETCSKTRGLRAPTSTRSSFAPATRCFDLFSILLSEDIAIIHESRR